MKTTMTQGQTRRTVRNLINWFFQYEVGCSHPDSHAALEDHRRLVLRSLDRWLPRQPRKKKS